MSLIFQSQKMKQVVECARRFAQTSATILIWGESGTGKELVARYVHQHSSRRQASYVRLNCAALSETLLESELFGHEAGAFTGALQRRRGRFEEGMGGTVFLDEVGELSLPAQAKLLHILEEREFQRVGGNETIRFDGRILAATNRDLAEAAKMKRFRLDLYHRLNVLALRIPALRERREDIPPLVQHFIQISQTDLLQPVKGVSREVMKKLCDYPWPGNVRELKNVILRSCLLASEPVISHVDLPVISEEKSSDEMKLPREFETLPLAEIERRIILLRLEHFQGNKTEAAAALGVTPRTLRNKVMQYRRLGYAC